MQREEIAASRERQQQELQEKARERDELLRQRRLARVAEEEQRMSQSNFILWDLNFRTTYYIHVKYLTVLQDSPF